MAPPRRKVPDARTLAFETKIEKLQTKPQPTYSGPENLDLALDEDIVVEKRGQRHRAVLMVGGEPVGSTNIIDYRQNVGRCVLRVGAIAGVHTPMSHRFRGYSRRVMINALRWMRQAGYDMTLLFGIRAFYPKFGYVPVFPGVRYGLALSDLPRLASAGYRTVPYGDAYLPAILRMYRRSNSHRIGPICRDAGKWRPFRRGLSWGMRAVCRVLLDRDGRPAGYYVYDRKAEGARIVEVGYITPAIFGAIISAAVRLARRRNADTIAFHLPEDEALMEFCKPWGLVKEVRYRRDGGGMARMINISSALEKLAPLLAERMSGTGRITIRTNMGGVALDWSKRVMTVHPANRSGRQARLPQWALAQMLYGYRDAKAFADAGVLKASADVTGLLTRMFPSGPHYYYLVDAF